MADRTSRTQKKAAAFLLALRESGNVRAACEASGVPRRTAYEWRDADVTFREQWNDAIDDAVCTLEKVAWQRATESSDTLLIFLLKAHRPEQYRDNLQVNAKHEHSGPDGAPIAISFFDANAALTAITSGSKADS